MSADVSPGAALSHAAPSQLARRGAAAPRPAEAEEPASPSRAPGPNPAARVDWALNIVVLQFVDGAGHETYSIPSRKQLQAYREQAALGGLSHGPSALAALDASAPTAAPSGDGPAASASASGARGGRAPSPNGGPDDAPSQGLSAAPGLGFRSGAQGPGSQHADGPR